MSRCTMSPLVHGWHDGRLGKREAEAVQRHLRACRACQQLALDLQQLATLGQRAGEIAPLRELEHRRRRQRLLASASSPEICVEESSRREDAERAGAERASATTVGAARAGARRMGTGRQLLLAACALAALLLVWVMQEPQSEQPAHAQLGALAITLGPQHTIQATVEASAGSRVWRALQDGIDRVQLLDGTILTTVDKLAPGQRFIVATRDAEVEVRGTRFLVRAEQGQLREVNVLEGKVEVRHGAVTTMLLPGQHWQPAQASRHHDDNDARTAQRDNISSNAGSPSAIASTDPRAVAMNGPASTKAPTSPHAATIALNATNPSTGPHNAINASKSTAHNLNEAAGPTNAAANPNTAANPNIAAPANATGPTAGASAHPKQPPAGSPTTSPAKKGSAASHAFIQAMELLEKGRYNRASKAMRIFLRHHPDSALAEDAAFMNAIALQRAGRHAAARRAAREYLKRYPNGDHRAQARQIANSPNGRR